MIEKLTYKQWFFIYVAGIFLSVIIIFQVAIKPTLEARNLYKEKNLLLESLSSAPLEIQTLREKLNQINHNLNSENKTLYDTRDDLLEEISNFCIKNRIHVYSYPELHLYNNRSFVIESNRIVLKGTFKNLLKLIYHMETNVGFSRIASIRYYTELNRKTKREELFLEMIFQNINDHD
jgi:hypothetical protein